MKKETIAAEAKGGVGEILEKIKERELIYRNDIDAVEKQMSLLRSERDKDLAQHDGREWEKELSALQSDLRFLDEKWKDLCKTALLFELKVAPEKRAAGESIQQLEGERLILMATTHFRLGVEAMKLVVAQNWPLCKTELDAFNVLNSSLTQCMESAFENALSEQSLPKWCVESVKAGL